MIYRVKSYFYVSYFWDECLLSQCQFKKFFFSYVVCIDVQSFVVVNLRPWKFEQRAKYHIFLQQKRLLKTLANVGVSKVFVLINLKQLGYSSKFWKKKMAHFSAKKTRQRNCRDYSSGWWSTSALSLLHKKEGNLNENQMHIKSIIGLRCRYCL